MLISRIRCAPLWAGWLCNNTQGWLRGALVSISRLCSRERQEEFALHVDEDNGVEEGDAEHDGAFSDGGRNVFHRREMRQQPF